MRLGPLEIGLILVIIIAVIGVLVFGRRKDSTSKRSIEILEERYARGEIDKLRFEQMKKDLS